MENRLVFLYFILCMTIFTTSCSKDESHLGEDYILFGHFYGQCVGELCVETFALTEDGLFEDTNDIYRGLDFKFVELSKSKFDLVSDLKNKFPEGLLDEDQTEFGCPDCGDWGGTYVGFKEDGELKSWFIDTNLDDIPEYLHDFVTDVHAKIQMINE